MKEQSSKNKTLCRHFCAYFKPGKNEELACRGYEVVERLIDRGVIPVPPEGERIFDRARAELLVENLCIHCDFREDGCDFMLDRNAPPCGGFIVLARLIESGTLSVGDIDEQRPHVGRGQQ
jgi:hypothetical protein